MTRTPADPELADLDAQLFEVRHRAQKERARHVAILAGLRAEEVRIEDEIAARRQHLISGTLPKIRELRNVPITNMQAAAESRAPLSAPRLPQTDHPAAVYIARVGGAVAWGRTHGYGEDRVKSWYKRGPGRRPIPERAALIFQQEAGIPATNETWPQGIIPEGLTRVPREGREARPKTVKRVEVKTALCKRCTKITVVEPLHIPGQRGKPAHLCSVCGYRYSDPSHPRGPGTKRK